MLAINADRLAAITTLSVGKHKADSAKMCAMEAVAYIAGEPWSDAPACASPVIASFMRLWNDGLPDADRTRLLLPLVPEIVGTRTTDADDVTREWMASDWLVRTYAPAWLTFAGLSDHAVALAGCDPVTSGEALRQAVPLCESAESAAVSAAVSAVRSVAESASWYAALSAVMSAAESAVRSAAGSAAWSAAGDAALSASASSSGYAAWSAVRSAAWSAVRSAAAHGTDLAPTVAMLQASAQDLVRRMCAVGRSPEEASGG
jgi:hypothetical protein